MNKLIKAGLTIAGLYVVSYLVTGRKRAIKRDGYAVFGDKKVIDVETTDFVLRRMPFLARFDPYAVTNAVLSSHGIYKSLGGKEDDPIDKIWCFK